MVIKEEEEHQEFSLAHFVNKASHMGPLAQENMVSLKQMLIMQSKRMKYRTLVYFLLFYKEEVGAYFTCQ